jgi:hypothetical protein
MRALRTVTLVIALAGASTAYAEEAKKPTPMEATDVAKLLAFYNELVDHAVKHAAECAGLASALDGVVNRNMNTIQMTWAAKKAKKIVPPEAQQQLDKREREMVGALRRCWSDDRVKAVFKRMKIPDEKKKE